MATKADAVKNLALSKIGCPYVMGGTGKECTVAYRTARANQYPDSAARIRANCQQMKGSKTTCHGCKWYDEEAGHGKPCYDCAQLNLAAMAAAGIPLVSGANSQWLKTVWSECGTIDNLPKDKVCCVFREAETGKLSSDLTDKLTRIAGFSGCDYGRDGEGCITAVYILDTGREFTRTIDLLRTYGIPGPEELM